MVRLTGFNPIADREQFLVAYPDGIGRSWADGRGITEADQQRVDDVAFIRAMLDDIGRRWPLDTTRIYVAGISNGGFMSERLACDAGDRIAAIGVIAATLSDTLLARCRLPRPVAVVMMNGTDDPLVPFGGGEVRGGRGRVQSAPTSAATWAQWNHCAAEPRERTLPDTAGDGTTVTEQTYQSCATGAAVVAYRITGGGHTWPGGSQYLPVALVGRASRNLAASDALWEFFATHPR
jgi:polyhydroxybutyrate depolymerase